MKKLYFHEDFYCQVELLPMSALESMVDEMREIDKFAAAHWDGTAWTAVHLRPGHSQYLRSLGIPINALTAIFDPILERVDEIYTGTYTHTERCDNTRAWVLPCGTALLADFDATGIVEHLWIVDEPPRPKNITQFQRALRALSEYGEFFIADWNLSIAVACSDEDQLMRYLSGTIEDGV